MSHPFNDRLFVLIGAPRRCSRQAARDALYAVGGVPEDRFSVYTHYAVAFDGAEHTKLFETATERDSYGRLVLLNEEQFFDVIEGKAELPAKKKRPRDPNVIVLEPTDKAYVAREEQRGREIEEYVISQKRLAYIARYGVPTPDGGRVKTDMRTLGKIGHVMEMMKDKSAESQDAKIIYGKTATVTTTVDHTNTASAVGSGSLDVFSTPMMIALMERAACECLADALEPGQTSVGTFAMINHVAASLPGSVITATATVTYVDGRKVRFNVFAKDGEKEIGDGEHTRMIIDTDRFMSKLKKKNP